MGKARDHVVLEEYPRPGACWVRVARAHQDTRWSAHIDRGPAPVLVTEMTMPAIEMPDGSLLAYTDDGPLALPRQHLVASPRVPYIPH